ncbi:MAG TPA: alpha/beta hydrolase fold domain-containing protein, partial [Micropepsaceae bacterium]|nr:alpha/beta hydrolase fold domain-containing protein [Micropepsaceae bacterium]
GDSGGGYLAATVCQQLKQAGEAQPALQLLIYPNTDATMTGGSMESYAEAFPLTAGLMRWFYGHYLNNESERSDLRVSPGLNPDLAGLAPARIYAAGFDPLLDQGAAYAEKLRAAGVSVTYHCFDALAHAFTMMGGGISTAATANHRIAHETGHALRSMA